MILRNIIYDLHQLAGLPCSGHTKAHGLKPAAMLTLVRTYLCYKLHDQCHSTKLLTVK